MKGDRNGFVVKCRTASVTFVSGCSVAMFFFFTLLCFGGCAGSETSKYYMLYPMPRIVSAVSTAETNGVSIGIGPVIIPEYLNRPQIVTRTSKYEIDIAEFSRWADMMETAIPRVITENLSSILSTEMVSAYPWGKKSPDYQIQIDVLQFDGGIPGNVEMMTRWTLLRNGAETGITRHKFYSKKPIAGQGYPGLVSAMSLLLYDMSREIADVLTSEQMGDNAYEND